MLFIPPRFSLVGFQKANIWDKEGNHMDFSLRVLLENVPMILCVISGIVFLVVEIFAPGFGLPGLAGLALIGIGVWTAWNTFGAASGIALLLFAAIIAVISIICSLQSAAFEILSIDIADVDVGRNIGAELQMDQAEADRRIAQAKAEERRAMAVAREQEMKASVQEMRAKVVEAEAEVPLAMAEALKNGKLGVMDYYRIQNTVADTEMRKGIGEAATPVAKTVQTLINNSYGDLSDDQAEDPDKDED